MAARCQLPARTELPAPVFPNMEYNTNHICSAEKNDIMPDSGNSLPEAGKSSFCSAQILLKLERRDKFCRQRGKKTLIKHYRCWLSSLSSLKKSRKKLMILALYC